MSRLRTAGIALLLGALVAAGTACSDAKDGNTTNTSDRGVVSFADPPAGSDSLGLCYAYPIQNVKKLIGGGHNFKRLAPAAIGSEGDAITGEVCAFERKDPDGNGLSLRIEARDYGDDRAGLSDHFDELRAGTLEATDVPGVGDAAFASTSADTSLLQVRSGGYLLTLASRADGKLEPIPVDTLKLLAGSGLERLP